MNWVASDESGGVDDKFGADPELYAVQPTNPGGQAVGTDAGRNQARKESLNRTSAERRMIL